MDTRTLVACTLLFTACDRGAKDPPAQAAQAAPAAPAAPVVPVTAGAATTAKAPGTPAAAPVKRMSAKERASAGFDAAAAKGQASAFREQLAAGRKAVKAKDYASGIAALEGALKIDPNHAAALAELGWADYLAGNLERAQRHTERAIAGGASDRTRGAALYNLGRILEDRGEKDEAATAYQRSLALRPNDVVQTRLASLTAGGAEAGGHECDFDARRERPPEDLCAALISTWAPDEVFSGFACFEGDSEPGEVAVDAAGTMAGGEPRTKIDATLADGIKVAHFTVSRMMESGGAEDVTYLAVLYADRWSYIGLGTAYNPGVGYIGESVDVASVEVKDVVPGGRPELVVTLTYDRHDGDYGINSTEIEGDRKVAVLSIDGESPRWLGAFMVASVQETMAMIEGEPSDVVPKRSEQKTELRFDAATGEVELSSVPGFAAASPVGRFKLGAVAAACPAALDFMAGG